MCFYCKIKEFVFNYFDFYGRYVDENYGMNFLFF